MSKNGTIEFYQDKGLKGRWRWVIISPNATRLACSIQDFQTLMAVKKSFVSFSGCMQLGLQETVKQFYNNDDPRISIDKTIKYYSAHLCNSAVVISRHGNSKKTNRYKSMWCPRCEKNHTFIREKR